MGPLPGSQAAGYASRIIQATTASWPGIHKWRSQDDHREGFPHLLFSQTVRTDGQHVFGVCFCHDHKKMHANLILKVLKMLKDKHVFRTCSSCSHGSQYFSITSTYINYNDLSSQTKNNKTPNHPKRCPLIHI